MKLITEVEIEKAAFQIKPFEKMLFVGSCFAENIGKRFIKDRFKAVINPFGTMYNPASVLHTIENTDFSPNIVIITLGTNHVYILKETGEIVDNCQKLPQSLFVEKSLSIDECVYYLSKAIDTLIQRNKCVKAIITVSPIRYKKYGFHQNQLSKATLLLATEQVINNYKNEVYYFPAYEIVNDELRDYRFYNADMLHPTEQTAQYIYEKFSSLYFSQATKNFIKELSPLIKILEHRPFNSESTEYKKLINDTHDKLKLLESKYSETKVY